MRLRISFDYTGRYIWNCSCRIYTTVTLYTTAIDLYSDQISFPILCSAFSCLQTIVCTPPPILKIAIAKVISRIIAFQSKRSAEAKRKLHCEANENRWVGERAALVATLQLIGRREQSESGFDRVVLDSMCTCNCEELQFQQSSFVWELDVNPPYYCAKYKLQIRIDMNKPTSKIDSIFVFNLYCLFCFFLSRFKTINIWIEQRESQV